MRYPEHQPGSPASRGRDRTVESDRVLLPASPARPREYVGTAGAGDLAAQRWRDLLALEVLALAVLRDHGVSATVAELYAASSHRFLEVETSR